MASAGGVGLHSFLRPGAQTHQGLQLGTVGGELDESAVGDLGRDTVSQCGLCTRTSYPVLDSPERGAPREQTEKQNLIQAHWGHTVNA